MAKVWDRLVSDVEVKKQLVAIALVAFAVMVGEAILYFCVIVPEVRGKIETLLRGEDVLRADPAARQAVRAVLGTAVDREAALVGEANRAAYAATAIIVAVPALTVALLYLGSHDLRRAAWRPILLDVFVVLLFIGLFQVLFYHFGHRWAFPGPPELGMAIVDGYRARALCGQHLRAECPLCPATLAYSVWSHSPTMQRAAAEAGRALPAAVRPVLAQSVMDLPLVRSLPLGAA